MNMKSLFALTLVTAATAASATVTTGNTLCRIEVASAANNTIVSVPLKTIAGNLDSIKLTDLVLTDGLSSGDHLLHWNAVEEKWEAWVVQNNAWVGVSVSDAGVTTMAGTDTAFPLSDAFWLVRANPTSITNPTGKFYLYGQVPAATADMPGITRSKAGPTYIMMGNPSLADVAINALPLTGTKVTGDKILVTTATGLGVKEYTYNGTSWTEVALALVDGVLKSTVTVTSASIPAGQGFWYVAKKTVE